MNNKRIIIAIDGHSSCGKSTFAKAIAARLGYIFIDTGAMYRTLAYKAISLGIDPNFTIKGVGFDACTDVGGGTNPNYCQDGRFISYKLDVKTPGVYNMAFRVAKLKI